ncbi:hypothetical protein CA13_09030 [Planctomycetes bacterium CA13]|uniref:Uncharacterized protein n=1 Tax=Novipirellula herctigrandis TaxID=2527986 RepID=A0A5C5YXX6_9BACT|nr:hypothetical protein CA13_09030 [Planctomycetes bacterium CA13]
MRTLLSLALFVAAFSPASAQLIGYSRFPIERATDTLNGIDLDAPMSFKGFGMYFDGGSYGARFETDAGIEITLFLPHYGYWSDAARTQLQQPVVFPHKRNGKYIWIEIEPKSNANASLLDAIDSILARDELKRSQVTTLKRVRKCVEDRKPLKEVSERIELYKRNAAVAAGG